MSHFWVSHDRTLILTFRRGSHISLYPIVLPKSIIHTFHCASLKPISICSGVILCIASIWRLTTSSSERFLSKQVTTPAAIQLFEPRCFWIFSGCIQYFTPYWFSTLSFHFLRSWIAWFASSFQSLSYRSLMLDIVRFSGCFMSVSTKVLSVLI